MTSPLYCLPAPVPTEGGAGRAKASSPNWVKYSSLTGSLLYDYFIDKIGNYVVE
jgi:hypothetical protein